MLRELIYRPLLAVVCYTTLFISSAQAQLLKPGFSRDEYIELMLVSAHFGDSAYRAALPAPKSRLLYESPVVGLDNKWELWMRTDQVPVISLRGTTKNEISWMENFYAAMVKASGELIIGRKDTFRYRLAENPRAAVHTGWLTGLAYLSKTIIPKIDSLYKEGHRSYIILGHSQGASLAFLLNAYLRGLQAQGRWGQDIRWKTWCSAAPKPGNLYFAYDYEGANQGGWSLTVVNAADWVTESPVSIQTLSDYNEVNPFRFAKGFIKKQSWPKRWALNYAFGRINNPTNKSARNFEKYLGKYVAKIIRKQLNGFEEPAYAHTMDYVRTGTMIVLRPDSSYYQLFKQDPQQVFNNHLHPQYIYLASRLTETGEEQAMNFQNETWELQSMPAYTGSLDTLYPARKPSFQISSSSLQISGHTGCNSFSGKVKMEGNRLEVSAPLAMTKMFCPGGGEQQFLQLLQSVNRYVQKDNLLLLQKDNAVLMVFIRK